MSTPDQPDVRTGLIARLRALTAGERERLLLDLVRVEAAEVLDAMPNRTGDAPVDPERPLRDQGFDSIGLVALHGRINRATGLDLPPTVVFDHATTRALAALLGSELLGESTSTVSDVDPVADGGAGAGSVDPDEPIAVIGIGCRFPGRISCAEDLWALLSTGGEVLGPFPDDRGWDLDGLYDPDPDTPRRSYVRHGGFLEEATRFDPDLFGISPREALAMDPQQRIMLETAWEAFEDAGIDPTSLHGSRTGIYVGAEVHEYGVHVDSAPEGLDGYLMTGNAPSVVSGRVAYTLGLEGPAVTVDTACSGAVVSLHLAAAALRRGECTLALAGGVAVMGSPGMFTAFSRQRGLAPDGRVKAFADAADGTGFSEGVGLLAVERLSDARRNGHRVLAVVRSTAVNQDGASNGLTAPSGTSQQRLIRAALRAAGLAADDVDAVDAHGTGTTLGDPIEAEAIIATYGRDRAADHPLWLGSVKSNLGHTQAAGGAASLIKMILAMRHERLPRTLHVDRPSSRVRWPAEDVRLLTDDVAWPRADRPRRAGVSAFGISGTNAHAIIEEAPPEPSADPVSAPDPPSYPVPVPLSAHGGPALAAYAGRLLDRLDADPALGPAALGHALATGRATGLHRRAVIAAADRDELLGALRALADGADHPALHTATGSTGTLAFLMPGQGSQAITAGRGLAATHPVFADALEDAVGHLDLYLDRSLWDVLDADEGSAEAALLDRTGWAQCALFAVEVALYRLLESQGVTPDVLAGHSVGEIAAAHVAGVLSLPDAAALVASRGRLMDALPDGGAMLAVAAAEDDVDPLLDGQRDRLGIAAVNSPTSTVLSGDADAVDGVAEVLAGRGIRTSRLRVSHAFHSPLMAPMIEEFRQVAGALTYHPPQTAIVSTVTGAPVGADTMTDPAYWVDHVLATVRFRDAVESLVGTGVGTLVEVGPGAVLSGMTGECLAHLDGTAAPVVLTTMRRDREEVRQVADAAAAAAARRSGVDWRSVCGGVPGPGVALPTYAFQRRHFWLESAGALDASAEARGTGQEAADHPLLGAVVHRAGSDGVVLTGRIGGRSARWIADHVIDGRTLLPGTAFVELALRAGDEVGCERVDELVLREPLALDPDTPTALQVTVGEPGDDGTREIEIWSRRGADRTSWTRHASGRLGLSARPLPEPDGPWPPADATAVPVDGLYDELAEAGYAYGPGFRGVRRAWVRGADVFAAVELPDTGPDTPAGPGFGIHPALLDAVLHASDLATGGPGGGLAVPFAWSGVTLHASGATSVRARITSGADSSLSLVLTDDAGRPVLSVDSLAMRSLDTAAATSTGLPGTLHRIRWRPVTDTVDGLRDGRLLLVGATGTFPGEGDETVPAADAAALRSRAVDAEAVVLSVDPGLSDPTDPTAGLRDRLAVVLDAVREWTAQPAGVRLVVLTSGAVEVSGDDRVDLVTAPVWGLVRAAQAEAPGRIVLVDAPSGTGTDLFRAALALGEDEVAIRDGMLHVPRLAADVPGPAGALPDLAAGTVLVTGGTGGVGATMARHLVSEHGVRHLVLLGRSGAAAPGAPELTAELESLGARVTVTACDVADRDALAAVLAGVPSDVPVTGVVHAAGALADGLIADLGTESLETALRAKADGAWYLHELTRDLPLRVFVVCSSTAGFLDSAGQGNYAAANVFLEALTRHRRHLGLPGTALAWGLWPGVGMGRHVDAVAIARMTRAGLEAVDPVANLALLDRALGTSEPVLVPVRIGAQARAGDDPVPPVLSEIRRAPRRRAGGPAREAAAPGGVADSLAGLSGTEREDVLLRLVTEQVAAVLGHASAAAVDPDRVFGEVGFDSLASVDLRNRLASETGLQMPATLVFDHPSPRALARHLTAALVGDEPGPGGSDTRAVPGTDPDGDPVVIVGMACRYPGGVRSPEQLWDLVDAGADAVGGFPADRGWDLAGLYDPDPGTPGRTSTLQGGFLYDAADFDAAFFGIGPREAQAMDPQQRLMLEVCWEAFERAGIVPRTVRGTDIGVYTGVMYHDWGTRLGSVPDDVAGYLGNGSLASVVSGRVAYTFGLEGPAVTVDTACSSSLVALHMAVRALRAGEIGAALAGGVTVMSTPDTFVDMNRQRGLAPDGRCKSFADAADGTGWSEGAGVLLLERLSDARRKGHPVLAVVRGSAINQDGASHGLTAPNGPAQQRVIRSALADAGLGTDDVDLVDGHGTGTVLGDPIEAQALAATYGSTRPPERPVQLGSVKSNLGHTQAAAGVAGVMKVVLAMQHATMPRTLHVDAPSGQVEWDGAGLELLAEARAWPETDRRRAAVSSFGISGTNAHVVLEQALPTPAVEPVPTPAVGPVVWPLSARTDGSLRARAEQMLGVLSDAADDDLPAIGRALAHTRDEHDLRAVAVGADRVELTASLETIALTRHVPGAVGGTGLLFSGQGSQRLGMGRELFDAFPVFAGAFDAVCAVLDADVRDVVWGGDADALARTRVAQQGIFAVQVGLFRLLESWGVRPDVVGGHSVGEIAAAHCVGVLSLADAGALVRARGNLMEGLPSGGVMVALAASEEEVVPRLCEGVDLAAVNGPSSVVLSGVDSVVESVVGSFADRRRSWLSVSHAFHSVLMEPMLDEFAAVVAGLEFGPAPVSAPQGWSDPGYWVRHVRGTVRFADTVDAMAAAGVTRFVEVGPSAALSPMISGVLDELPSEEPRTVVATARAGADEVSTALGALAALSRAGSAIDWAAVCGGPDRQTVPLPTYPFDRARYWLDALDSGDTAVRGAGLRPVDHPVLGALVNDAAGGRIVLTGRLSTDRQPWLADHRVHGTTLLPGTGFVELALRAGAVADVPHLEELTLLAPLVQAEGEAVAVQVALSAPDTDGARSLEVFSRGETGEADWRRHASGRMAAGVASTPTVPGAGVWPPPGARPVDVTDVYERLVGRGYGYGPAFRGMRAAWRDGDDLFAEVELPDGAGDGFEVHPALLDAAMHVDLLDEHGRADGETLLPFSWIGVRRHAPVGRTVRVHLRRLDGDRETALDLFDVDGRPLLSVGRLSSRPVTAGQLDRDTSGLLTVDWTPRVPSTAAADVTITVLDPDTSEAPAAGPGVALLPVRTDQDPASTCVAVLDVLQRRLEDDRTHGTPVVVVTRGGCAVRPEDVPGPAQAAVWGLVRAATAEHPGRFVLLDADRAIGADDASLLGSALATGEPELALRGTTLLAPRLTPVPAGPTDHDEAAGPAIGAREGTVLVTGGTGGLGARIAEHLVTEYGVRDLVLTGRRGPDADGAAALADRLTGLGAEVDLVACDVTDRDRLAAVLAAIPAERPLRAVVHAAAVVRGGLIGTLDPDGMREVFRAKYEGARHLHELTATADLDAFVLLSSAGGHVLAGGQGDYAAANLAVDALAAERAAAGLPALAIAYGMWSAETGLGGPLRAADLDRMARLGTPAIDPADGLAMLDAALRAGPAAVVALRTDPTTLLGRGADVPALLRTASDRERQQPAGAPTGPGLAAHLAGRTPAERDHHVLDLVRRDVAGVLGLASADDVGPDRALRDLGFDSLAAVELRNSLTAATGIALPATLVFDHPTSREIARLLVDRALPEIEAAPSPLPSAAPLSATPVDEPIAIVGTSCRFPGDVRSVEDLWDLVAAGHDAVGAFPTDRGWDLDSFHDPRPGTPGRSYVDQGGFLHDAARFDPEFFGIMPREAVAMDPQQRLLLEGAWEAVESAGIAPTTLQGSRTGVYVGIMYHEYGRRPAGVVDELSPYLGNGSASSIASGRVAYTFGWEGPAITVDTACSSSLVSLHLACQALRAGEVDAALAGGVTVMPDTGIFVDFSQQRGLAADGRCKSFADAADGTGWSEGMGLMFLERLSDARRHGHRVLAVVRGSAVNQDGSSNGLTAPNGAAQQAVIRDALAAARLGPDDVDVVEGHGTGTTLGDPIEAQALLATYGAARSGDDPLWLGSVKSNLGHAQAASGVSGVLKMVMALRHGRLPRTLHVDEPSTNVDWSTGAVRLLTDERPFPARGRARRAAVSSFGLSGTNAHVILEQVPEPVPAGDTDRLPLPLLPLVVSAQAHDALPAQARRLAERLQTTGTVGLLDVAASLATARAALPARAVLLARDGDEALAQLRTLAVDDPAAPGVVRGTARPDGLTAFVFSGQGAQQPGMGADLYASFPVFAEAYDQACATVDRHRGGSIAELVRTADAEMLARTENAQPALFVFEVALYRLLESWGIVPDVVGGHSVGEITAAHVAGVFDLDGAARLLVARGRAMALACAAAPGAMAAVEMSEGEAYHLLDDEGPDGVAVAAVNGPRAVVLSGPAGRVDELVADVSARGRRIRRLDVAGAFHTALMEPAVAPLRTVAASVARSAPRLAFVSNVTGRVGTADQWTDPEYWAAHVREPVRFADGVTAMADAGVSAVLEIGPDAALAPVVSATAAETERRMAVLATRRRGRPEVESVLEALGRWHAAGRTVDWTAFFGALGAGRAQLPTYAFRDGHYWLPAPPGPGGPGGLGDATGHPLLGTIVRLPDGGALLGGQLSVGLQPWVADHVVDGAVLLPGTALLEVAARAGEEVGCHTVAELVLHEPVVLDTEVGLRVQVGPADGTDGRTVTVHTVPVDGGTARLHASGRVTAAGSARAPSVGRWPPPGAEEIPMAAAYERLTARGYDYGPAFRGLRAAWRDGDDLYAEVELPVASGGFGVHPALLDAAMHVDLVAGTDDADRRTLVPYVWSGITRHGVAGSAVRVHLRRLRGSETTSLTVTDLTGAPLLTAESIEARERTPVRATAPGTLLGLEWDPVDPAPGPDVPVEVDGFGGSGPRGLLDGLADDGQAPATVVWHLPPTGADPDADTELADATSARMHEALAELQGWLLDPRAARSVLAVVTHRSIPVRPDDELDLAGTAVCGLLRAAQLENPGQLLLLDTDGSRPAAELVGTLAGLTGGQGAVRDGRLLEPRLAPDVGNPADPTGQADTAGPAWPTDGTVLVTGGLGGLGAEVARHLVRRHGVRHLLLVGRRGGATPGADRLVTELVEHGARVRVAAADVADRDALASVLATVPADAPLRAVVHLAGAVDDGPVTTLSGPRCDRVLDPKARAALHLDVLTDTDDLAAFVLFSSSSVLIDNAGQGSYAAANAVLDGLAHERRRRGRPGQSLAWHLWSGAGMAADLPDAVVDRQERVGTPPHEPAEGLRLWDTAGDRGPVLVPIRIDPARLSADRTGPHALLRTLATPVAAPVATDEHAGSGDGGAAVLRERFASADPDDRRRIIDDVVLGELAAVRHDTTGAIDPTRGFTDLGLDSLAAIELRNALAERTGLRLPATMMFDHPDPEALSRHLVEELALELGGGDPTAGPAPGNGAAGNGTGGNGAVAEMDVEELIRAALGSG